MRTFAVRTKAYERVMSEETLRKLRETRRANQADFTLSCTEGTGNRFTISQAALEELTLDVNSASFDVVGLTNEDGSANDPSEVGAYLLVLKDTQGIFFKGSKAKDGGKKSKTITYDKLVEDLQAIGQVPAELIKGQTKALFDLVKVEGDVESGDPDFQILSAWKLVPSTKTKSSDEAEETTTEESVTDTFDDVVETAKAVENTDEDGFGD